MTCDRLTQMAKVFPHLLKSLMDTTYDFFW